MRNLLEGWCEPGPSLEEALGALPEPIEQWWKGPEFEDHRSDDRRAAMYLWAFTGLRPERRDLPAAGDGRADLVLHDQGGGVQVAEVLATIDPQFQQATRLASQLVAEMNGSQPPARRINVHLDAGWIPPRTKSDRGARRQWRDVLHRVREEVEAGRLTDSTAAELEKVFPSLRLIDAATDTGDDRDAGFVLASWHAKVPPPGEAPYLERLSMFLSEDPQAIRHVRKLEREAAELDASRSHLYLLMASAGAWGNLLPSSPSWMTDGQFQPPKSLTDLWLDGGTGYVMHWRREQGWVYHTV